MSCCVTVPVSQHPKSLVPQGLWMDLDNCVEEVAETGGAAEFPVPAPHSLAHPGGAKSKVKEAVAGDTHTGRLAQLRGQVGCDCFKKKEVSYFMSLLCYCVRELHSIVLHMFCQVHCKPPKLGRSWPTEHSGCSLHHTKVQQHTIVHYWMTGLHQD